MGPSPRPEPRWMSLTDLMVLVAGCAVGYSLQPFAAGWVEGDVYGQCFSGYDSLLWTFRTPLLILAFAVAAVIMVRQARYGRMPRPAEWPALVLAAFLVGTSVLDSAGALGWAGWPSQFRWIEWHDRGLWPELILFGVPIVGGLRHCLQSGRRRWTWTEWIGLVPGLVLAACWLFDGFAPNGPMDPARLVDLVVRGLWLAVIGLASWLIFHGCDAVRDRSRSRLRSPRSSSDTSHFG